MSLALRELAPAKLNFSLEVLRKRPDGFHDVRMLLAGLDLCDELSFRPARRLSLRCDLKSLDCGEKNLVLRAARLLQVACGVRKGAALRLRKRIPVGGGLAGGSTDAAAALRGLNRLWRLRLSPARLHSLAAQLGSDVPFCLRSGWAIASGRGERLKRLSSPGRMHLVLANPGFEVSTAWAYSRVRPQRGSRDQSRAAYKALKQGDGAALEKAAVNDLAAAVFRAHPQVRRLKALMQASGAELSQMSGSGPTVWGLFKDRASAEQARKAIHSKARFSTVCSTIQAVPR